jgi:hypothetical protein
MALASTHFSQMSPPRLVQRWLGHASLETTAIYADVVGPEERAFLTSAPGQVPTASAPHTAGIIRVILRFNGLSLEGDRRQHNLDRSFPICAKDVWASIPPAAPMPRDRRHDRDRSKHYDGNDHDASMCDTPHAVHSKVYSSDKPSNRNVRLTRRMN